MPLIRVDAHQHLWHYSEEEYAWIGPDANPLRRDFLPDELFAEMGGAGIAGAVAVQARQTVEETDWLLTLARKHPEIWGVVGWLPLAHPDLQRLLEARSSNTKLTGLRHVVQGEPAGFLFDAAFNRGLRVLTSVGLPYDILIYESQLIEATQFVDLHPQQSFVLDHIAKPKIRTRQIEPWAIQIRELARRPHVVCKVSGMVTEADPTCWTEESLKPYFDVVLEAFGPDRLMVGSDWPVLTLGCSYVQWWHVLERWIAQLSPAEQELILGGTAMRTYRLHNGSADVHVQQKGDA